MLRTGRSAIFAAHLYKVHATNAATFFFVPSTAVDRTTLTSYYSTTSTTTTVSAPERLNFSTSKKESVQYILANYAKLVGTTVVVGGWVRTGRLQIKGTFGFVELNDGSCFASLQVVMAAGDNIDNLGDLTATGASLLLRGTLTI